MADESPVKNQKTVDSEIDPNPNLTFPYTDGALEVEGQKIYVPKTVLAEASPVFKRMFESEFKEKNMEVIQLPEKKVADVTEFLKCLYPFINFPITGL